jgi:hypothetical protein
LEDEEEIQNFWGQLWFVPKTNPVERTRVREARGEDLVWIRRDLWLAKTFDTSDCHLVGDGDKWDALPSKLSFAENIWGEGKRRSFARVLKETMAGRGRGRGPRSRNPEGDWENWGSGGWNQFQFPQPPPPPVFYNQPPPPPYGYFPNQAQVHHPPLPILPILDLAGSSRVQDRGEVGIKEEEGGDNNSSNSPIGRLKAKFRIKSQTKVKRGKS